MKTLFNNNWYFAKTLQEAEAPRDYCPVQLPHDWLIYNTNGLYETSFGHYRKTYDFGKVTDASGTPLRSIRLYFEGIYMDSTVYVNGVAACDWKYGYSSFEADLTHFLHNGENEVEVLVRHRAPNTRWYSGAGIFRDVWLIDSPADHLVTDSVYFHADKLKEHVAATDVPSNWKCSLSAEAAFTCTATYTGTGAYTGTAAYTGAGTSTSPYVSGNTCSTTDAYTGAGASTAVNALDAEVQFILRNGTRTLFTTTVPATEFSDPKFSATELSATGSFVAKSSVEFTLSDVTEDDIWDIKAPHLLTLETLLLKNGQEIDRITQKTGLRDIEYTADHGFFLNGRHVKLHGVCLHHDLGCLGAAFQKEAARRQLASMMEMGVNAIRTSHNMPAAGLMELCDEMGILVDSEAYDMWERAKTEFDNARFFDDYYKKDVASWIRRDRNHPSVIMWSIGNEIYDTHVSPRGCEVAKMLHEEVRVHDPLKNAPTTIGSNYMPWEGAQNCAREVDLVGYNYGEYLYDEHHAKNPGWLIYGSETTSGVKSRGIYHFPRSAAYLTHEDLQCSSLGNCRAGVSADTAQKIIALDRDCEHCAGMFIWTGADYIGEPSPYSTKNSYFGCIDTAGLRKDLFYLYQAAWGEQPVLHLLPYWDYNEGQLIDVVVYTNLPKVELFVNGKSQGIKAPQEFPQEYTITWQVPYQKGEIRVVGTAADGTVLEDTRHSFGDSAALRLACSTSQTLADARARFLSCGAKELLVNEILANGEDLSVVEISTVDADGNPVENACDRVQIEVTNGRLLGYDNGDSTDYDPYKCASRRLFAGKAAAYIAATTTSGPVTITATSEGLTPARLTLNSIDAPVRDGMSQSENCCEEASDNKNCCQEASDDKNCYGRNYCNDNYGGENCGSEVPVRKIELIRSTSMLLTPESGTCTIQAVIHPANATYHDLTWSVVTESGIETNLATIELPESTQCALLTAVGDGSFRLRCSCTNGKPQATILSEYEFTAQGFGQAYIDPYAFLPGCLHNDCISIMDEVSKGGVNIKPDNNLVGFTKTDFGKYGTDRFLVRIINWHKDDPFNFRLWIGRPGSEGAKMLGDYTYQANFIWQTYQDNHYELPYTLTGLQDIYFEFDKVDLRIDFGGFQFEPRLKAYEKLAASDYSLIHGDNYAIEDDKIVGIGNNVFIDYEDMNFAEGTSAIRLTGRTRHDNDSVHVHFVDETGAVCQEIIEVPYSENYMTITKELPDLRGRQTVKFQFLPGCDFDFAEFEILSK